MIGGVLFIAGWVTLTGLSESEQKIAQPWLETPMDFAKIQKYIHNLTCIFSNDDPYVTKINESFFRKNLNAKIKHIGNEKHIQKKSNYKFILDVFNKSF
jgi:predicted alpha/beta hydrolase family esterase